MMLVLRVFSRFLVLRRCCLCLVTRLSVFRFAIVLTCWMLVVMLDLDMTWNRLTLLAWCMRALLYSLAENVLKCSMWILLLHPLLNSVTVLKLSVRRKFTRCILVLVPFWTLVPMRCLTLVSLVVLIGRKREKLKCSWLGVIRSFPRVMRALRIPCSVVRSRRAVERPSMAVLCCVLLMRFFIALLIVSCELA